MTILTYMHTHITTHISTLTLTLCIDKATPSSPTTASEGLREGMIVSIEPGYYEPGHFGIRLENLYVVTRAEPEPLLPSSTASHFLRFQSLTFIPFQKSLVDERLLSEAQRGWLAEYHRGVLKEVGPLLMTEGEVSWLQQACEGFIPE